MKTLPRIFLIHGYKGSPEIPKWFSWLSAELKNAGYEVSVPKLPFPAAPKVEEWNECIEKTAGGNFKNIIFVGHSLGGLAAIRAIEAHGKSEKAKAVIFVGVPFLDVGKTQIKDFLPPMDFDAIKQRVERFVHISSIDDPYVPHTHAELLNEKLPGNIIKFKRMSHFQKEKEFKKVLDIIKNLG